MSNFEPFLRNAGSSLNLGANEARSMAAIFCTAHLLMDGTFRSLHQRFSDAINAVDQEFVLLYDVETQLLGSTTDPVRSASVFVARSQIIIASATAARAGQERPHIQQDPTVSRISQRVNICAWPFEIEGLVHLGTGTNLLQYIHEPLRTFMPVTDASVSYIPNRELSFDTSFLMVNRRTMESIVDVADMGKEISSSKNLPTNVRMEDQPIAARRVAELLAATDVFRNADVLSLEAACTELCQSNSIMRKIVEKGVEVFNEGDVGNSMYLIEEGRVEVSRWNQLGNNDLHVGYLGIGEWFGEMAVLGDQRRAATVRTITESRLVALNADAIKALLAAFPAAATALLQLMIKRQ